MKNFCFRFFYVLLLNLITNYAVCSAGLFENKILDKKMVATEKGKIITGGMQYHLGFYNNSRERYPISGTGYGLGGKLAFHIGQHFRVGGEGFSSNYSYKKNDGFVRFGYGGLLISYQFWNGKIFPVANLVAGGGRVKDIYVIRKRDDFLFLYDEVIYRNYTVFVVNPSFGFEYLLNEKIKLAMTIDYLINLKKDVRKDFPMGPKMYFGILFSR